MNEPLEAPRRVMFVDDDPDLLAALAASLRRKRRSWDMHFVCGGAAAVQLLQREPWDAVITDMKMPDVDGEAVLRVALEQRPQSIRLVLTGQAEYSAAIRTLGLAHRFVHKPCSPTALQDSLTSLFDVCFRLDPLERRVVCGTSYLPADASVLRELEQRLAQYCDTTELTRSFAGELSLSAKLLHLVNGGFFGHSEQVSTVEQALTRLNREMLRALVVATPSVAEGERLDESVSRAGAGHGHSDRPPLGLGAAQASNAWPIAGLGRLAIRQYQALKRDRVSYTAPNTERLETTSDLDPHCIGGALAVLWGLSTRGATNARAGD